jgi:hypothetical protein
MRKLASSLFVCLALVGCSQEKVQSAYDVSSEQVRPALRLSAEITRVLTRLDAREASVKAFSATMPTLLDKLGPDADRAIALQVVQASDRAGGDGGYAAERRRVEELGAVLDVEFPEIVKRVGGAAQYAGKQAGCSVDLYSAVSGALRSGIDDRVEERQRASNDAFVLLDRYKDKLGKKNLPLLDDAALKIADASYTVRRELPLAIERLDHLERALDAAIAAVDRLDADERTYQGAPERTVDEIKASAARQKVGEEEKQKLQAAREPLTTRKKAQEERSKELLGAYETGLRGLEEALRKPGS